MSGISCSTILMRSALMSQFPTLCLIILLLFNFHAADACGATPDPTAVGSGLRSILGGNMDVVGYSSGATGGSVNNCDDLFCDFRGSCRWKNVATEDQFDWQQARGQADPAKWRAAVGTSTTPDEPYGIIANLVQPASYKGKFVSDPIDCQDGNGDLSFDYFVSPGVEVRGCWRYVGDTEYQDCSPAVRRGEERVSIPISQSITRPFELVIEATKFDYTSAQGNGGVAIIDNINYCADFCGQNNGRTTDPPRTTRRSNNNGNACDLVKCTFDQGTCRYQSSGTSGGWRQANAPVGNPLTGVPSDPYGSRGPVLVSEFPDTVKQGRDPGLRHVLESPEIEVRNSELLSFKRYQATAGTRLRVCTEQVDQNCEWESPPLAKGSKSNIDSNLQWKEEVVRLPPGIYKLFFVSDYDGTGLYNTGMNAVGDIKLLDSNRNPIC